MCIGFIRAKPVQHIMIIQEVSIDESFDVSHVSHMWYTRFLMWSCATIAAMNPIGSGANHPSRSGASDLVGVESCDFPPLRKCWWLWEMLEIIDLFHYHLVPTYVARKWHSCNNGQTFLDVHRSQNRSRPQTTFFWFTLKQAASLLVPRLKYDLLVDGKYLPDGWHKCTQWFQQTIWNVPFIGSPACKMFSPPPQAIPVIGDSIQIP